MLPDYSLLEGDYLRDLLAQPHALEATLRGLKITTSLRQIQERLALGDYTRVVLTGMGSSFHALHGLEIELQNSGYAAFSIETSELIYYHLALLGPKTLIIAVSQSGQSAELVRLLEANHGRSTLISVTNTADSPLAVRADATVLTQAGQEFSVSCKTYVAALMALAWLGGILCAKDFVQNRADLDRAHPLTEEYLTGWREHVEALVEALRGVRSCFLAGRGTSLSAVGTGALITKEAAHFPTEGLSSAAFRHGPLEIVNDDIYVLVFEGDEKTRALNTSLLDSVLAQGGRSGLVGEHSKNPMLRLPASPAPVQPILEILPVQMMTLALAVLAGRRPGVFERATKITNIE
jgi:glucosamine--fructose-6-phosphate aminotransferase (isomerizing)